MAIKMGAKACQWKQNKKYCSGVGPLRYYRRITALRIHCKWWWRDTYSTMCVYTAFGQLYGNFLGGTIQVRIGSECIVKPCMCILNELQEFHHEKRRYFMLPIPMCRAQALTWYDRWETLHKVQGYFRTKFGATLHEVRGYFVRILEVWS